ncbi:hypothetical protein [Mesorhizobium onobrychidis]|uniref:hypothetical protein n=1 Tax=Mesorhizobium onobrychidis TaxID=2775404 RepID=UPI0021583C0B|nr:hypothetical protein [Mesorhizobium onobrychidis]
MRAVVFGDEKDRIASACQTVRHSAGSRRKRLPARIVREHWRDTLGLGRDQTLAAAYWRLGAAGLMAG